MRTLNNIHDRAFKSWMSDKYMARDALKAHLSKELLSLMDLKSLEPEDKSFIDPDLSEAFSDQLYRVNFKNKPGYLYLLYEHQSTPDKLMPMRLLHYMCRIMYHHVNKKKKKTLPIIVPMVLYTGKKPYTHSTDIFDLFEDKELARQLMFKPFSLIEVWKNSDEKMKQRLSGVLELVFKYVKEPEFIKSVQEIGPLWRKIETISGGSLIISTYQYCVNVTDTVDAETLAEMLASHVSKHTGEKVMTAAERLMKKGEARGKAEGKAEGKAMGIAEVARRMLVGGMDLSVVVKMTGLSLEEIKKLSLNPM